MERIHHQDETTEVISSGVQSMAGLIVPAIICLAAWGMHRAGKNY